MKIYIFCAAKNSVIFFAGLVRVHMRVKIMNFRIPLVVASEKGTV